METVTDGDGAICVVLAMTGISISISVKTVLIQWRLSTRSDDSQLSHLRDSSKNHLYFNSSSSSIRQSHFSLLQNTRGKEVLTVLPKPMMQIFCLKVMAICLYFPDSGAVINRMIGLVDGKQIPVCLSHLLYLQTDIIYKSFCCE